MKRSRSAKHNARRRHAVASASAAAASGRSPSPSCAEGEDDALGKEGPGRSESGPSPRLASVSASSIASLGPGMRSQTASAIFPEGRLPPMLLPHHGPGTRVSGHNTRSTESGGGGRKDSTALVESAHSSDGGATASHGGSGGSGGSGGQGGQPVRAGAPVGGDSDDKSDGDGGTRDVPVDASETGQGPLPIERDWAESLGMKRGRSAGGGGVSLGPKQRRRVADSVDGRGDCGGEEERERVADSPRPQPTPRPRRHMVLTATPAFVREERVRQQQQRRQQHPLSRRSSAGAVRAATGSAPPPTPMPARSPFSRGCSHLRDAMSLLRRTPVPVTGTDIGVVLDPSPWGLSSIRGASPRPSIGSMGATARRAGSDFVISLWPEEREAGPGSQALRDGTGGAGDRLAFLRTPRHTPAEDKENARPSTFQQQEQQPLQVYRQPPAPPLQASESAAEQLHREPVGPAARHATPSLLSESLLDIISSASGSDTRASLPAGRSIVVSGDGGGGGGSRGAHRRTETRDPSIAPTLMEPELSPIERAPAARSHAVTAAPTGSSRGTPGGLPVQSTRHQQQPPQQLPQPHWRHASPLHGAGGWRQPHDGDVSRRYDYIAAVTDEELFAAEGAEEDEVKRASASHGARSRHHRALREDHEFARRCRWVCAAALSFTLSFLVIGFVLPLLSTTACPLLTFFMAHRGDADEGLAVLYVNPVAELHALYQVPAASLGKAGVTRLYHRVLSESVERLEAAVAPLAPQRGSATASRTISTLSPVTATHEVRVRHLRQLLLAHEAARRRAVLYARSRDHSSWRRWVTYPLRDAWDYGLARHGFGGGGEQRGGGSGGSGGRATAGSSTSLSLLRPSLRGFVDRTVTVATCLSAGGGFSDMSIVPNCPSLRFREEAMLLAARAYLSHDVNAAFDLSERQWRQEALAARLQRDWDSEVYLETLLRFVRRDALAESRSGYNS